jgi:hypothetical protein
MESPEGTRKKAKANKQKDKKSLRQSTSEEVLRGGREKNGKVLDQNDVDSLTKEKPCVILKWKFLSPRGECQ